MFLVFIKLCNLGISPATVGIVTLLQEIFQQTLNMPKRKKMLFRTSADCSVSCVRNNCTAFFFDEVGKNCYENGQIYFTSTQGVNNITAWINSRTVAVIFKSSESFLQKKSNTLYFVGCWLIRCQYASSLTIVAICALKYCHHRKFVAFQILSLSSDVQKYFFIQYICGEWIWPFATFK